MKKQTLKNILLYTLLAVSGFAFWYLAIAFVTMELNFANWKEMGRFAFISLGLTTSAAAVFIYESEL